MSGMARDRSGPADGPPDEPGSDIVTTGGTGFGIMAVIVAAERGWVAREEAAARLLKIARFLLTVADSYHGLYGHYLHGATGRTIHLLSRKDDGADLVETAFLMQGLLCARQYFDRDEPAERELRQIIGWLWAEAEWDWHTRGGLNVLYWHWSPTSGWSMNHEIRGWNECLIAYVLAAAAPRHAIDPEVYHRGWAQAREFINRRRYYGLELPLGPDYGGPLFFAHYSFLGLDPRGLADRYADYWRQNVNHTLINHRHCARNPHGWKGYGPRCWGLTASDSEGGYVDHSPTDDRGVITPTAALSSFPYAPQLAMGALRHFYHDRGEDIWGEYGFVDAFSPHTGWRARSYLAIDQGPIVVMIENHRTGLLWRLFMSCPEVRTGLRRLGFTSPHLDGD
ncbi:MAG: beta-glucosidase [Rhodospirillaceae bacterium]|nr:beta-glucosidase [Rhodospirillaceae bacterium]